MNFFFIEEILLDIIDEKVLSDKCDECDKSFSTKGNLKKHKDRVHVLGFFSKKHFFLPDNSFNCTHCGKIFTHKVKSVLHFIRYLFLRNKCFISTRSISLISNMGLPIHYSYALFQIRVYRFSIPLSISVNYCVVFYQF